METAETESREHAPRKLKLRDLIARSFGVGPDRKEEIYVDVSRSASLLDVSYWLQLLFSAGIATLGLVLNSTAVIIGAMLISPLMGPILATGLAFAAGDLILGIRGLGNLLFSSFFAIMLATVLVAILPFKELTAEIAARTEPNTLDLVIALFSGAIGSIAICREVRGVVTSIPGVAIAVALMPPLCVVGYGIGVSLSLNPAEGMRVARGGGLLFLTNLAAITFTAMVVFFILHIDIPRVRKRIEEWRQKDRESAWVRNLIVHLPIPNRLRMIGSLPGRFLISIIPILIILFPLSQSFNHLGSEIARKQRQNEITRVATELWQKNYANYTDGKPRSYIGQVSTAESDDQLTLQLRIFTSLPYSAEEQAEYTRLVANQLQRTTQSVILQLIEIPTATSELLRQSVQPSDVEAPPRTIAQLQADVLERINSALVGLNLPASAVMIDYSVTTDASGGLAFRLSYLGRRPIDRDGESLLRDDIRARLGDPEAGVELVHVSDSLEGLSFLQNSARIQRADSLLLNRVGEVLKHMVGLEARIGVSVGPEEKETVATERQRAVAAYLQQVWGLDSTRAQVATTTNNPNTIFLFKRKSE